MQGMAARPSPPACPSTSAAASSPPCTAAPPPPCSPAQSPQAPSRHGGARPAAGLQRLRSRPRGLRQRRRGGQQRCLGEAERGGRGAGAAWRTVSVSRSVWIVSTSCSSRCPHPGPTRQPDRPLRHLRAGQAADVGSQRRCRVIPEGRPKEERQVEGVGGGRRPRAGRRGPGMPKPRALWAGKLTSPRTDSVVSSWPLVRLRHASVSRSCADVALNMPSSASYCCCFSSSSACPPPLFGLAHTPFRAAPPGRARTSAAPRGACATAFLNAAGLYPARRRRITLAEHRTALRDGGLGGGSPAALPRSPGAWPGPQSGPRTWPSAGKPRSLPAAAAARVDASIRAAGAAQRRRAAPRCLASEGGAKRGGWGGSRLGFELLLEVGDAGREVAHHGLLRLDLPGTASEASGGGGGGGAGDPQGAGREGAKEVLG